LAAAEEVMALAAIRVNSSVTGGDSATFSEEAGMVKSAEHDGQSIWVPAPELSTANS
jgi:hypothetical protein